MEKTLAERAEEARLEEENRRQKQSVEKFNRVTQAMVDYFSKELPDAVHLGDRKFQLGDEVFTGSSYASIYGCPIVFDDDKFYLMIGNPWSSYYSFSDLAGYGRYLHNKSLRSNKTNNTAMEEKRPQPKESWFTNFINWAKRYGK